MNENGNPGGAGLTRGSAIVGMVVTFLGGYFLGDLTARSGRAESAPEAETAKRRAVPVGLSPSLGATDPLVTIVEFADFQCGFCARSLSVEKRLLGDYAGQVRWVWKNFPLPMHGHARAMAEAALAANAQGRFWEYHDRLFSQQGRMAPTDLEDHARELGLELGAFRKALGQHLFEKAVQADVDLASTLAIEATPTFYINGRVFSGSMPYDRFEAIVREEIAYARQLLRKGVPRARLYEEITRDRTADKKPDENGQAGPSVGAAVDALPTEPKPPIARAPARENVVYRVPAGKGPSKGAAEALVTVIFYYDYQCEHSAALAESLAALEQEFGERRLRVFYKQFPMRTHPQAQLAAEAALAAHDQGQFDAYSARLFAERKDLSRDTLFRIARELGLQLEKFAQSLDGRRAFQRVAADSAEAARFGSTGTPTLFINGHYYSGDRPRDELKTLLTSEMKRAIAEFEKGTARDRIYDALIREGLSGA
jgi:protein-disulfide isomerase